jgi:transposase
MLKHQHQDYKFHTKWYLERAAKITAMWQEGYTISKIADHYLLSYNSIRSIIASYNRRQS